MEEKVLKKVIKMMMHGQYTLDELGLTSSDIRLLKDMGYQIQNQKTGNEMVYYIRTTEATPILFVSNKSRKVQEIKFIEASDLHFGSKQFDEVGLKECFKRAMDAGFIDVHISGDIVDGFKVYPGHMNNLRYWKCEDQANYAAEIMGMFPKLNFIACKGNHDYSYEKQGSVSPLFLIAQQLPNFTYLNGFAADIIIAGIAKRMVHVDGGRTYAKSYVGQTYIRNLLDSHGEFVYQDGKKYRLRLLQLGHYHFSVTYESAGIYVTHPGSFQFPNDYTIRRGLVGPNGCRFTTVKIMDEKIVEYNSPFIKPRRR